MIRTRSITMLIFLTLSVKHVPEASLADGRGEIFPRSQNPTGICEDDNSDLGEADSKTNPRRREDAIAVNESFATVKGAISARIGVTAVSLAKSSIGEANGDLLPTFRVLDEIELKLLSQDFDLWEPDGSEEVWSIYLIRPAREAANVELTELRTQGRTLLRYTRAFAPLNAPIAIVGSTRVTAGKTMRTEFHLVYEDGTMWRQHRAVHLTEQIIDLASHAEESKIWETIRRSEQHSIESFRKAAVAAMKCRMLLGLTRQEVEAKLGKPSFADWFVSISKPRFMGDHLRYERRDAGSDEYPCLGLFFKDGKVYSCYFALFSQKTHKAVGRLEQESAGKPIRWTIN